MKYNPFDAERERIGRQLEQGAMTQSQHRALARAIDRAEARAEAASHAQALSQSAWTLKHGRQA